MARLPSKGVAVLIVPLLIAGSCPPKNSSSGGSDNDTPITPPPVPPPPPPPQPIGIVGNLPIGLEVADGDLHQNIDMPDFHFPRFRSDHYNDEPNLSSNFPRLTGWAECTTERRSQNVQVEAKCIVTLFQLVQINQSGTERVIARFDLSELRRGQKVACSDNGYCAGANYRRESDDGTSLCWYSYCVNGEEHSEEGQGPMINGEVTIGGELVVQANELPWRVSHWWTQQPEGAANVHPRTVAGSQYYIDVRFRTVGAAVLRVGADRWTNRFTDPERLCERAGNRLQNNCELFFSNWFRSVSNDGPIQRVRFQLIPPLP